MGDDKRSMQPRPLHPYPPQAATSGEITTTEAAPEWLDSEHTPPPIIVDDIGRQVSRSRRPSPDPDARGHMTTQEFAEGMWPLRKLPDEILSLAQRTAVLEQQMKTAQAPVSSLRLELVGEDGDGGIIGHFVSRTERDLADQKRIVGEVDERATRADRFVRRVITAAAIAIITSLGTAAVLVYRAGEHAAESRGASDAERSDLSHKIESLDSSLTDLRSQVRLLLDHELGRTTP